MLNVLRAIEGKRPVKRLDLAQLDGLLVRYSHLHGWSTGKLANTQRPTKR